MTPSVQNTSEGQAAGTAPDYGYTVSHVDTLYFPNTLYRNSTMYP